MVASAEASELARSATEFYDKELRQSLEATHRNEFIAIEPESRSYFFGKTMSEAIQAARRAQPERYSFVVRVGHRYAIEIGLVRSEKWKSSGALAELCCWESA